MKKGISAQLTIYINRWVTPESFGINADAFYAFIYEQTLPVARISEQWIYIIAGPNNTVYKVLIESLNKPKSTLAPSLVKWMHS